MKITIKFLSQCLASLCMAAITMPAAAQTNVGARFNKLIGNSAVTITENHLLNRDETTGVKTSQCDIYRFSMPKGKMSLIKDIEKAFRDDAEEAYSICSGVRGYNDKPVVLSIGEGNDGAILAGQRGMSFVYACFLDPKDKDGHYRYAYGADWVEDGDNVVGTLVVTYGTTLKYRQQQAWGFFSEPMEPHTGGTFFVSSDAGQPYAVGQSEQQSWFSELMTYAASMATDDPGVRRAIAARIYEHVKNVGKYSDVTKQDKATAFNVIQSLINETSNVVETSVLNGCLQYLK